MVGRTIKADILDRPRLREFEYLSRVIEEHDKPENLPSVSKTFGVMKAIDAIPVYLREWLGTKKIPLSYIICDNVTPSALLTLATDRITPSRYTSMVDELIEYAPHTGPEYNEDDTQVFQIIQDLVAGTSH
mmetsp:Transcript_22857/g.32224  ORF Transcript_22857/g.32224 Transcript_22857/m.32224 type:complete len:131 (+) Transcript_22857:247-639(+)